MAGEPIESGAEHNLRVMIEGTAETILDGLSTPIDGCPPIVVVHAANAKQMLAAALDTLLKAVVAPK